MIYPIKPRGYTIWSDKKRHQLSVMPMCLDDILPEDAEVHALEVTHSELIYLSHLSNNGKQGLLLCIYVMNSLDWRYMQ